MTRNICSSRSLDARQFVLPEGGAGGEPELPGIEVLEALRSGIIVTDNEAWVLYMNPAARLLTGWQHLPTGGVRLPEVLRLETSQNPRRRIEDALLNAEDAEPFALELTGHDGVRHPIEIHVASWQQDGGGAGRVVYEIRDIAANVRRTKRLIHEAAHDSLTGLINRRELRRRLYELITGHERSGHVLVILDLDGFKRINDECGHLAGDEVLRDISGLLQGKMRIADSVARLGGDEFAVLLYGCLLDEALSVAEELRHGIGDYNYKAADGGIYRVTASLGVTCVTAAAVNIDQVIQRADSACYRAKSAGGDRVYVHDGRVLASQHHFENHNWELRLRRALPVDGLVVHCEEIRSLTNSEGTPKCAIVPRMRVASDRWIGPEKFMSMAARSGMALQIDHWLIAHTLQIWNARSANGIGSLPACFVTLSKTSLDNAGTTAQFIEATLGLYAIPAGVLCVEIKERDAIANWPATMQLTERLSVAGVQFCLSDFGVGLYTLGYLKRTRFDFIKLAVELVGNAPAEPFYSVYRQAIINVARSLDIEVIGVGAESDLTLLGLQRLGVQYVQYVQEGALTPPASFSTWTAEVDGIATREGHNEL